MSTLDDIIARDIHETDAFDIDEAHHAIKDREYLLGLVKELTTVLESAVPVVSGDFNGSVSTIKQDVLKEALQKVKA
jgi:hypothetical protein